MKFITIPAWCSARQQNIGMFVILDRNFRVLHCLESSLVLQSFQGVYGSRIEHRDLDVIYNSWGLRQLILRIPRAYIRINLKFIVLHFA